MRINIRFIILLILIGMPIGQLIYKDSLLADQANFEELTTEKKVSTEDVLIPVELSLQDVVSLALNNSLDIQIAQYDAYIKRTSLKKEESIFDTYLKAHASYKRDKKQYSSSFAGSETKEQEYSLGLEKKLPTGTTVSVTGTDKKVRTDSAYSTINPYHDASAKISVVQELGSNFFGISDRATIKLTKLDIENSDLTSLDDIEQSLYATQKSYWNLALKGKNISIAKEMLKTAERLYAIYKNKYPLGLVEESELLAMEALVYSRQSKVDIALLEKETAKNELLFLLNQGELERDIVAKDNLDCSAHTVNLYNVLQKAIEYRRDYKQAKNDIEKNKIDIVVKKNALWPEIDLEASFIRNGLEAGSSRAWEGVSSNNDDEVFLKLSFKLPLENRKAKSGLTKANLEKAQYLIKLKRIERLILKELNDKVSQVNAMENQVKLFKEMVEIHEKKLDEQIKRLDYGRSDADTLIRYEEDFINARLTLAQNLFNYRVSLLELELTQNSLLDKYWQDPLGAREYEDF